MKMFPCEMCKKKISTNEKILVRLIGFDREFIDRWFHIDCYFDYFQNLANVEELKKLMVVDLL